MRWWPLVRNRDYMLLWSGETVSELGSQTSTVAYPLLVLALTGSPAKAGLVGMARWLPLAIFALPAGALADRLNRKLVMIASDAIRLIGAGTIVAALWVGRPAYPQIVVVAFLDGALLITSHVCERGALREIVPARQLQDAVAQNEARSYAAGIVGPPLGGAMFAAARALPFLTDAVSFLGSMTAVSLTKASFQPAQDVQAPPRTIRSDLLDGLFWLRRQPFFWTASRLFAVGNPAFLGLYLLAILLAKHDHASSAAIGGMLAVSGFGGLAGAAVAGPLRRRLTGRAVIAGGECVFAVAVLLLLLPRSPLVIGLLVAFAELPAPVTNSLVAGSRAAAAPGHLQGRVAAVSAVISMSLGWLGPLAVGFAFQHAGPTATILLLAGWILALATAAVLAPGLRHEPPRGGGEEPRRVGAEGPAQVVGGEGPTRVVGAEGPARVMGGEGPARVVGGEGPTRVGAG